MKLLGISGTNGSGKDSVGAILVEDYNYLFISVTELLRQEAKRRSETTDRLVLRTISAQWRREFGLGVLVDRAIKLYAHKNIDGKYSGLAVASLRNPGEVDRVHELGGKVLWVDADATIRYKRIYSRDRADDRKSYEQFLAEEQAEMSHSGDSATLSMIDVKKKADLFINNNGTTLSELQKLVATLNI